MRIIFNRLKDVAAKIFQPIDILKFLLQSANKLLIKIKLLLSEMQKKLGVTDFVSEIKRVENYTDFEKLTHATHHGLQGLKLKISRVSQSRHTILLNFVEGVCCVNNSKCYQRFQKNLALQEAFETVAQIKKRLKKRDSTGVFCKKLLVGKLSSLNHGKAIRHWPFAPGITVHYNTSFSVRNDPFLKMFSVHTKTKSQRF